MNLVSKHIYIKPICVHCLTDQLHIWYQCSR